MQNIQDLLVRGGDFLAPVFQGVVDLTATVIPGITTKDKINGNGSGGKTGGGVVVKENPGKGCCHWAGGRMHMPMISRSCIRLAGISGAFAVGLGAYGAHVIMKNEKIGDEQKNSYRTANLYHFIGTFGLVASSLAKYPIVTGTLMAVGTFLFCGTCYYHGLTGNKKISGVAPFGGTTLILAWLSLIL
jgi:uncharacterized membrane protein YgdD (TMEM256/DUF423 family)